MLLIRESQTVAGKGDKVAPRQAAQPFGGEVGMAASDELRKLADRAQEAEQRAVAARTKARADLEQEVETARSSAQAQADELRKTAEANQAKISIWWHDVQRSWSEHVAAMREDIEQRRAEHDVENAERSATNSEEDAAFAVNFAYAAIEEAEYAVLDAALARMKADELSAASSGART
jgi:hypothetical protein